MSEYRFSDLQTDEDNCFLCGTRSKPITQEHVFPKWLQNRYGLWNQTLNLLNETTIQYRNLQIPCCSTCNHEDLSRLENTISSAISSGFEAVATLDKRQLYLWAGKLYFGVLRKEITLLQQRSDPRSGNILPEESLRHFSELHLFLQGIRGKHKFCGETPYSVLLCNLHDVGPPRNYSFRDNLFHMIVGIRLGEVGIIVALEDAGLTERSFGRYVDAVAGRKLHPVQFEEMYAKVLYQVSLIEGGVTYITSKSDSEGESTQTHVMAGGYLRDWSQADFSQVLKPCVSDWLIATDENAPWFVPPDLVPTWMTDETGSLLIRPFSEWEKPKED